MIEILTDEQIEDLRAGGVILARALEKVVGMVKPGMPTLGLDLIAETELCRLGAKPSFKFYSEPGEKPFPATICVSINDEVVHGAPTKSKIIKDGDLVSLDIGCSYRNLYTDMAVTVGVGKIKPIEQKLILTTKKALSIGIGKARHGNYIGDIGEAIEKYVTANGFSVVKDLVGHGIGSKLHQDPNIPNFGRAKTGERLLEGFALAIEPMVNIGGQEIRISKDGWTVTTSDQKKSAHFEHTVVVTKGSPQVVTKIN